jgi:hypothetical protein
MLKLLAKLVIKNYEKWVFRRIGMYIGNLNIDFMKTFDKLLLEGSFDLMFCTLINLYLIMNPKTPEEFYLNFEGYSDVFNSLITFISFFVILIYLPFTIFSKSFQYFNSRLSADQRLQIEQSPFFIENRRFSFLTMIYEGIFLLRRTMTVLMLLVFDKFPIIQMQVILTMALMNCMY